MAYIINRTKELYYPRKGDMIVVTTDYDMDFIESKCYECGSRSREEVKINQGKKFKTTCNVLDNIFVETLHSGFNFDNVGNIVDGAESGDWSWELRSIDFLNFMKLCEGNFIIKFDIDIDGIDACSHITLAYQDNHQQPWFKDEDGTETLEEFFLRILLKTNILIKK